MWTLGHANESYTHCFPPVETRPTNPFHNYSGSFVWPPIVLMDYKHSIISIRTLHWTSTGWRWSKQNILKYIVVCVFTWLLRLWLQGLLSLQGCSVYSLRVSKAIPTELLRQCPPRLSYAIPKGLHKIYTNSVTKAFPSLLLMVFHAEAKPNELMRVWLQGRQGCVVHADYPMSTSFLTCHLQFYILWCQDISIVTIFWKITKLIPKHTCGVAKFPIQSHF